MYSVDTSAFYTDEEFGIESEMMTVRVRKGGYEKELETLQAYYRGEIDEDAAIRIVQKFYPYEIIILPDAERIEELFALIQECRKRLVELKKELKEVLASHTGIRTLRNDCLKPSSVISLFESSLTRTIGMKPDLLSNAMIVVRVYFFDVFRDIVMDGFVLNGEKYVFLTASAGQIRQKKAVFIRDSLYRQYEKSILCGLSIEEINRRGGCNTNKYLAYLALCNSATDVWTDFDIDRAIVVDDMETLVHGVVDFIDDKTYMCERKEMDVPINHTDGCGMVLYESVDPKSFMVRLPWIKGMMSPFDFHKFIRQKSEELGRNVGVVKDIYGKEHDVIAEDIRFIFTKSQFKMWKYYDDWDAYRSSFKRCGCIPGICNVEDDVIGNASINYQMLQTLDGVTDEELELMALKTNHHLERLTTDVGVMLKSLGAVYTNENMDFKQKCLLLYPELLQDPYFRRELRQLKDSMERAGWSGKLDIYGKYLFIVPDLYAFCEWTFLGDKNPKGLLADGEVYSSLFSTTERLDCLRSPHLYREHAVRSNAAFDRDLSEWFSKRGLYTSCHDLISRILQFDVDGDKSLVCADKAVVSVAERTMRDVVPLYYEMAKAGAGQITSDSLYSGMTNAYIMGNIGPISNDITKIWNSEKPDVEMVKLLCMKNNFVIDAAKTLYTPIPPKEIEEKIRACVRGKTPWFFQWAKDKEPANVEPYRPSTVNRLRKVIPHRRMRFRRGRLSPFDYRMLMRNPKLIITPDVERIVDKYRLMVRNIRRYRQADADTDAYSYMFKVVRDEMIGDNINPPYVVDAIIYGIFSANYTENKQIFWGAFGDIVYESLQRNIEKLNQHSALCPACYCRYPIGEGETVCPHCGKRRGSVRRVVCEDCGEEFFVPVHVKNKTRCYDCQEMFRKHYRLVHNREKRRMMTR